MSLHEEMFGLARDLGRDIAEIAYLNNGEPLDDLRRSASICVLAEGIETYFRSPERRFTYDPTFILEMQVTAVDAFVARLKSVEANYGTKGGAA